MDTEDGSAPAHGDGQEMSWKEPRPKIGPGWVPAAAGALAPEVVPGYQTRALNDRPDADTVASVYATAAAPGAGGPPRRLTGVRPRAGVRPPRRGRR